MLFDYKVIPIPTLKSSYMRRSKIGTRIAKIIEDTLMLESAGGWELDKIKSVDIPVKRFFFGTNVRTQQTIIILRKLKSDKVKVVKQDDNQNLMSDRLTSPSIGPAYRDQLQTEISKARA